MKAILKVALNGKELTYELVINKSMTIGRTTRADLATDDPLMSAIHCRFILKDDRLEIYDMNSKNGVYLNGIRIERSEVFVNDTIKAGDCSINLEAGKMDANSTSILTFPGPFKDRVEHELKIDYSPNQNYNGKDDRGANSPTNQLRKKMIKPAPLSKREVKSAHKGKAFLAMMIDIFFLLVISSLIPLKILQWMATQAQIKLGSFVLLNSDINQNRVVIFVGLAILIGTLFSMFNFRKRGLSIGEKFAGFYKLMNPQT